jgi:YedE family putative selenium metabolism protein
MKKRNFFATLPGIILVGALIGIIAPLLQKLGNPPNMGICVACFNRDIAGSLGLHRAGVVQYMRPEIIGFILGSLIAAIAVSEFRPRGGSSPVIRFMLGAFAMIGALVFLGCPWRALLRLSGGDLNAVTGIIGLICGIWIATLFFRQGFSLGKSNKQAYAAGWILPVIMIGFLIALFMYQKPAQIPPDAGDSIQVGQGLWYSLKGPGSMHATIFLSLLAGLVIGVLAQRSRFCTMGAIRDLILFKQFHLLAGVVALIVVAFAVNNILQQFKPGITSMPIAHSAHIWNFLGMVLSGLAFALAGGCPGRQCFMAGEGDSDAAVFVFGMIVGAAFAHNFVIAAGPDKMVEGALKIGGPGPNGMVAVLIGLIFCIILGLVMRPVKQVKSA